MDRLKYFAYGSNMSPSRIQQRVPSAQFDGVYYLMSHQLRLHKIGRDGSAKGDAYFTGKHEDVVWGVLYDIAQKEKIWLDEAEGLGNGYQEKQVELIGVNGMQVSGFLYFATKIDNTLLPFDWYMQHIITGAEIASLPNDYVAVIRTLQVTEDMDRQRAARERAIYNR